MAAETNLNNLKMYRVNRDDLGKNLYKMLHCHDLAEHHKRMRMERSRPILAEIDRGTLPNSGFTDEKKMACSRLLTSRMTEFGVRLVQLKAGS